MARDGFFGEDVASRYDESVAHMFAPHVVDPMVDVLAGLARGGKALEFGIGTGRVALPLAQRGVSVQGIELSKAMVARLREKPGSAEIAVTIGDFATTRVAGTFALVYLVFNTIMNLTTQDEQVACFENASAHLAPNGCFLVEVTVPDLQRLPPGEKFVPFHVSDGHLGIDEYDLKRQGLVSHHYRSIDGVFEKSSIPFRYVWPAELDLMARLAGLKLRHRWDDWDGKPFTDDSRRHVSVWDRAAI